MTGWSPPPRKVAPMVVQTWPARVPEHRSYAFMWQAVNVPISQHDCRPVRDLVLGTEAPGVLMLEWDIALDGDDLRTICRQAIERPTEGFVCPYKLWPGPSWGHRIMGPVGAPWWVLREDHAVRWVTPDDPTCNLPCFGCIYVPRDLLEAWEAPPHDPRLTDSNFALWSRMKGLDWPILWDIRPVHLHY